MATALAANARDYTITRDNLHTYGYVIKDPAGNVLANWYEAAIPGTLSTQWLFHDPYNLIQLHFNANGLSDWSFN
jgi:hypothetical protein